MAGGVGLLSLQESMGAQAWIKPGFLVWYDFQVQQDQSGVKTLVGEVGTIISFDSHPPGCGSKPMVPPKW